MPDPAVASTDMIADTAQVVRLRRLLPPYQPGEAPDFLLLGAHSGSGARIGCGVGCRRAKHDGPGFHVGRQGCSRSGSFTGCRMIPSFSAAALALPLTHSLPASTLPFT